jgi:hypothetical protein
MKFLYRAEKKYDEGFLDYISRMSYFNGFSSSGVLLRKLCDFYDEAYGGVRSKKIEMYKVRLALEQLLQRNMPVDRMFYTDGCQFTNERVKVCIRCWCECRYIRYYWWFSHYVKCHIHDDNLFFPNEVSFESDDVVGEMFSNDVSCLEIYSSHLLTRLIMFYLNSDNAIELMEGDLNEHLYAKSNIEWVADYFGEHMNVYLNISGALELIDSGSLVGFSVHKKMESVYKELLVNNEPFEKSVRIITAIIVGRNTRLFRHSKGSYCSTSFLRWKRQELLSIDELFYAYIGFGQLSGTLTSFVLRHEMKGFENLCPDEDRQLCLAIFGTSISWPYGNYTDHDDDYRQYQSQMNSGFRKVSPSMKYNEYLATLGKKTIDSLEADN